MHPAPAVRYPVIASRRVMALGWAAWALGALSVLGAWLTVPTNLVLAVAGGATLLASAALWRRAARRLPTGTLAWDREQWSWQATEDLFPDPGRLDLHLDLQRLMLARFMLPRGHATWLWLDRGAAPAAWHALRCAVHGPRPTASSAASSTVAATAP